MTLEVSLLPVLVALALGAGPKLTKVAVLDIKRVADVSEATGGMLASVITAELSADKRVNVITRADVTALLGFERQRQLLGCDEEASCMAEIAGSLGVDYVLSGQLGKIGTRFHLTLVLIHARRAKVVAREGRFAVNDGDDLVLAATSAVRAVLDSIPARSTEPSRGLAPVLLLGASATFLAGGAIAGLVAKSRFDELDELRSQPPHLYAATFSDHEPGIKNAALLADVFYGAGALSAAAGLYLLLKPMNPTVTMAASLGSHRGQISVAARFE
jgi:TolB-like protein